MQPILAAPTSRPQAQDDQDLQPEQSTNALRPLTSESTEEQEPRWSLRRLTDDVLSLG
jgi:hypothetical protein